MIRSDRNTRFAWRDAPFGRIRHVPLHEAQRWKCERHIIVTAQRRDWSLEETDMLVNLLDEGYGYTTIAQMLRRSRKAVLIKVKRLHCHMTQRAVVMTSQHVAHLLGKSCSKTVVKWVQRGWLPARVSICNRRRIWRIQWDALMLFLHEKAYWMAWDAKQITDPDLRAEFQAIRDQTSERWLTPGQVAARYHVDRATINQWIQKGWIPAQRYGNYWVWSGDIDGWLPPCERSRKGIPRGAPRIMVGKTEFVSRSSALYTRADAKISSPSHQKEP